MADGFNGNADLLSEIVPAVINSLLFVVIVLELLGTVTAHFKRGGFQLRPFLIIGIISAVRHILTVGAKSSLGKGIPNDEFTRVMVEYGVNVGIIVALVIALAIISRTNADQQATGTAMTATRSGPAPLPRSRVGGSRDDQLQDPPPAQRGEFQ